MWNGNTTLEWAHACLQLINDWDLWETETIIKSYCISKFELLTEIADIYDKDIEIELDPDLPAGGGPAAGRARAGGGGPARRAPRAARDDAAGRPTAGHRPRGHRPRPTHACATPNVAASGDDQRRPAPAKLP